jgi:hypothetical protein
MGQAIIEGLEARALLSGNVTAVVVGGDLVISGDGARNRIVVNGLGLAAGEVRVQTADESTTVNGGELEIFTGVTGDVRVTLGGAADTVTVQDLAVAGELRIDGGRSSDTVMVNRVEVDGAFAVRGRSGDEVVNVLDSTVGGAAEVRTDEGDDRVVLDSNTFEDKAVLLGGAGDDSFDVETSTFAKGRTVNGQVGRDAVLTAVEAEYAFTSRRLGWQDGFSDYPVGKEAEWELDSGLRTAPAELGWAGKGFLLSGKNHSDDLFMFLKRQLGPEQGLAANTEYQVRFAITYATNDGTGSFGIGGSAGDSVYLRAGATTAEPKRVQSEGDWRMDVDKGDQATGGRDISVVGTITHGEPAGEPTDAPRPFREVTRTHVHTATVKTDAQGRMWVIVGTDSGFEGVTTIYVKSVALRLLPV